jgi:hypothetical protein
MGEIDADGFSDSDLIFLLGTVDRRLAEKIDILRDDRAFIESILENRTNDVLQRIMLMKPEEMLVDITPRFLFEVLLRAARKGLATRTYTMERTSTQRIPVFDAPQVNEFIEDRATLKYLASMLTSFTRIRSFTWPVRVRKGIWRRIRFNDMDIDSLLRYSQMVGEEQRFELYKRLGDLCLFILGIFPEHATTDFRPPYGEVRPVTFRGRRRSAEDYEEEGRRFYRLASEHQDARALGIDRMLRQLHDNFHLAKKPLNYISEHFLEFGKGSIFPSVP